MSTISMNDIFLAPPELSSAAVSSADATEDSGAQPQTRYLSKRPHRKSRAGCKQCKKRKVKCDEAKPVCKACSLRKEPCIYPSSQPPSKTGTTHSLALRGAQEQPAESAEEVEEIEGEFDVQNLRHDLIPVISEPIFIPDQAVDVMDMKMLWFYTTHSYHNFSVNAGRSPVIDYTLRVKVVEHAFRSPFLMETIKALSALDLRSMGQPVPMRKIAAYQARAFEGYRNAIETADPNDFPALLACSLFTIAMSSQTFRDPNGKRLFIVDWIPMWRGIGLIIELITPQAVDDSGLAPLFTRPPMDWEKAVQYIPNNLLFMVTSIRDGDADFDHLKDYYELLKSLGSLYQELIEHGFGPVLDLRVITFFSFCPRPLLELAKQYRPRMLVIIAYWLCFVKLMRNPSWWMCGMEPQAYQIFEEVGDEWEHLLRVPQVVMQSTDMIKNARLIIDNHNWTPGELDLYDKQRDPRTKNELKIITNEGQELEIADGQWRFKTNKIKWDGPGVLVKDAENMLLGSTLLYKRGAHTAPPSAPSPNFIPSPAASEQSSAPGLSPSMSASNTPSP
ncbi:hypothetical protein F4678DRAFT_308953 [Xylaria arbuscula]|nr:hypothetical protein F4678DRAFT_308953 [Xylaria arbuscula]